MLTKRNANVTRQMAERDLTEKQMENLRSVLRGLLTGLTQKQVAERIGKGPSTVSGILSRRQRASLALAHRIADAADIPIDEIMGKLPKRPYALDAAIRFAHATGIPESVTAEFAKTADLTAPAEDLYFEIRALARRKDRRR